MYKWSYALLALSLRTGSLSLTQLLRSIASSSAYRYTADLALFMLRVLRTRARCTRCIPLRGLPALQAAVGRYASSL